MEDIDRANQLREKEEEQQYYETCPLCGHSEAEKVINPQSYSMNPKEWRDSRITEIMKEKGCCFTCAFWFEKIEIAKRDPNVIWCRIKGVSWRAHLIIEKVTPGWNGLGCGGRRQYIRMFDGGLIESNNVWCQGDIAENFKQQLPDNAEFITKEQYNHLRSQIEVF